MSSYRQTILAKELSANYKQYPVQHCHDGQSMASGISRHNNKLFIWESWHLALIPTETSIHGLGNFQSWDTKPTTFFPRLQVHLYPQNLPAHLASREVELWVDRQMQHLKMFWGPLYLVTLHISCYLFSIWVNSVCPRSLQEEECEGFCLPAAPQQWCWTLLLPLNSRLFIQIEIELFV